MALHFAASIGVVGLQVLSCSLLQQANRIGKAALINREITET
jgi:hypothetical protein